MQLTRPFFFVLGLIMLGLGIVGALVPLMPSTIFLIIAAWSFSRSSRRLETWLLDHRMFGPTLRAWRAEGAISRRAKIMACTGMTLGFALFWLGARPGPALWLPVALALGACAAFVLSRPEPKAGR